MSLLKICDELISFHNINTKDKERCILVCKEGVPCYINIGDGTQILKLAYEGVR
jgi:hypothetical protein